MSRSSNLFISSSTASRFIEISSLTAVCGHPPVSTPMILSSSRAPAFWSIMASSFVNISFVTVPILYSSLSSLQSFSIRAVFPEPTGPPTPILTVFFISIPLIPMTYTIAALSFHAPCWKYRSSVKMYLYHPQGSPYF